MKENMNLLYTMLDDMKKQDILYQPTSFWEEGSKVIIKDFEDNGIEMFRSLKTSRGFFVPSYAYPQYFENKRFYTSVKVEMNKLVEDKKLNRRLEMLLEGRIQAFSDFRTLESSNINKSPYTNKVSESNVGLPTEQYEFNERKFSRSFLNYLLGLNFLKKHVDTTNISTVMEIGGGFGTLGEILLGDERNSCFYINADIPPVSFASSYYLKKVFGDKNIADYGDLRLEDTLDIDSLKEKYLALNICSWQIPSLKGTVDLFVNFISFQEMEPNVVRNYCKHVRELSPEFILLRNIEEGKKKKDEETLYGVENPILGNDYDYYLPEYELIATDSMIFGFVTEDNFNSQLRIYKKISKVSL